LFDKLLHRASTLIDTILKTYNYI